MQEPVAFSHRPGLGRVIVFARKAFYKLFLKWFMRPVLEQQNGFNQAAARLIEDLVESAGADRAGAAPARGRVEALERRLDEEDRIGEDARVKPRIVICATKVPVRLRRRRDARRLPARRAEVAAASRWTSSPCPSTGPRATELLKSASPGVW